MTMFDAMDVSQEDAMDVSQEDAMVRQQAEALGVPRVVWQAHDRFRVVQVLDEENAEIILMAEKAEGYDLLGKPRWTQIFFPYGQDANPLYPTCESWKDLAYSLMTDLLTPGQ